MLRPVALRQAARACGRCRLGVRRASSSFAGSRPRVPPAASVATSASAPAASSAATSSAPAPAPTPPQTLYGYFPETLPAGPPPAGRFPVDTVALRREFLRLQAAHHPDKHAGAHRAAAATTSAAINHAYRTLASPLLRAQYLLALRGVDVAADEALRADDPALLADVLAAHEAVEEAADARHLVSLRRDNDDRIRRSEESLDRAFCHDDVDAAKREAVRLRYWVNIKDAVDAWEEGKPVVLQH